MAKRDINKARVKKNPSVDIKKEYGDIPSPLPVARELGNLGIKTSGSFVSELSKKDLVYPNLPYTVDQMMLDPAVSLPVTLTKTLLLLGLVKGSFESTGSRKSEILANYANYVIHNMEGVSWFDVCNNIVTHTENGFSLNEIVITKAKYGEFKGSNILKYLAPRSPKSIYAWVWDEYQRNVTHVVQKNADVVNYTINSTVLDYKGNITQVPPVQSKRGTGKYAVIPLNSCLHTKWDSTFGNPLGNPQTLAAYTPWQEKNIISEYECIGISRDFGGVPVLRVPAELLERAQDPTTYPEDFKALEEFKRQLAAVHAGEQAFFILDSNIVDGSSSIQEYSLQLLGIDGSGKQFDTTEIINRKINEIHNSFSAGYLTLGQDGKTGAYNLSTAGSNIHHYFIEKELINIQHLLQNNLLPKLLETNNIEYSYSDLPKFRFADPDQLSLEESGKFIQRVASVMKMTPSVLEDVIRLSGLPTDGISDLDFSDKGKSRSGESQGTSGIGDSQKAGVASATNMENKQVNLVTEDDGDKISLIDVDSGKLFDTVEKNA